MFLPNIQLIRNFPWTASKFLLWYYRGLRDPLFFSKTSK